MALVNLLVEGALDEYVGTRLIEHAGHQSGTVYGKKGWGWIRGKVSGFSKTSRSTGMNYLAIVDLAGPPEACAPTLVASWLPHCEPSCILRVAVNEIESWLLADDQGISRFLGVPRNRVGISPDVLDDPKQHLINLARRSRKQVAKGIIPDSTLSSSEGRLYTANLSEFIRDSWDIELAISHSPSLRGCLGRLRAL